jgi:MoxR-like ATPase
MSASQFEAQLNASIGNVVFGAQALIRQLSIALIAGGHVLLEGVPGVGKTLLAKTLAQAIGGHFRRIQCTADLMPSDITGVHVFKPNTGEFELAPGPIFGNVVLVDEINRTGPKTQSALLEAMEERQVTIDRKRYSLPADFFLIASQNPHEFEGTYPLPESQLDRFLLKLNVPYPDPQTEASILRRYDQPGGGHNAQAVQALSADSLNLARQDVQQVQVSDAIYDYATRLARASREDARVALGLSTRGALALMRSARVLAALQRRQFVLPDDLKQLLPSVLEHRIVLNPEASLDGSSATAVVADLLIQVAAPRAETAPTMAESQNRLVPEA